MSSPPESLRHRTQRALLWSGAGTYGSSLLHLLALLGLGGLLPPTDFGLLALVLIAVSLGEGVGNLGLLSAVIQKKTIDQKALDSAFWCSLAAHSVLAASMFLPANVLAGFLGDVQAGPLLRLSGLVLILTGLSTVPRALLTRQLHFRQVSIAQLAGEIAFAAVGLVLATLGFGAWALVWAVVVQRLLLCIGLWWSVDYRPGWAVDTRALRELVRFGAPVMAGNVVERVLLRADYFVIGRLMGTEALGYYSLALQLSLVPLQRLAGLVRIVAFPAFSIVQEEMARLRKGLLEGLRGLLFAVLPVMILIAVSGPWLLRAAYGDKWEPSIGPLRILALAGVFLLPRLLEAAFLAVGRPRLRLGLSALRLLVFAALVGAIGARYGISGVAACVAAALGVWAVAHLVVGRRLLGVSLANLGAALWPASRSGALALVPLLLFVFLPPDSVSPWTVLTYTGLSFSAVYLGLTLPRYWRQLRSWLALVTGRPNHS